MASVIYKNELIKAITQIMRPVLATIGTRSVAIARQKASGEVVQVRTGDYRRSIRSEVVAGPVGPLNMQCRVYSDVSYAATIELGSRPHVIEAKNAPYLVFRVGFSQGGLGISGAWVRTKRVNHPGTRPTNLLEKSCIEAAKTVAVVAIRA